ncbi:MAG TPA: NAD-dependent epimerase/dehydratase family protein [Phycisphaerales bacterium]|nr:NAD-dependent epimerase/dehydratase family protein [Phycisphaerales bacterium]
MNVLILGGTRFIGRHIAESLLHAGHSVTVFSRGISPDHLPQDIQRLHGDRDAGTQGLQSLVGRTWDACIDVSGYTPRQVRPTAELLKKIVSRYVFISAVSVYGDPALRPVEESHPRLPPAPDDVTELNNQTYGAAKVACENLLETIYRDRFTTLRPQIVVGTHDQSGRYVYWLHRASQAEPMLAPGDGTDHLQVIDVRDVARFVLMIIERNLSGAFNLSGPRITWREFINLLAPREVVWVPADVIRAAGVTESDLPLFRTENGPRSALMDVSNARARTAGLAITNSRSTLDFVRQSHEIIQDPSFLAPERERELIQKSRQLRPTSRT